MTVLLNTLYVTTDGAYVAKDHETAVVRVERETRAIVPLCSIGSIVCFGNVGVSPALMATCAERGVSVSFLTSHGRFQARVEGQPPGAAGLRRAQHRAADDERMTLTLARGFILGKIANSRTLLLRAARESDEGLGRERLESAARSLRDRLDQAQTVDSLGSLRGVEGDAAATYFGVLDLLVRADGFSFGGRHRRPPPDPVNAMLSFMYTLVVHDAASALAAVGLDPAVGFLHEDRSSRPSLALDLAEEFRSVLADRLVLSLINRKQVCPGGFAAEPTGEVRMKDETRREVLVAYQKRKQELVRHPLLDSDCHVGMLVHLQARLLARSIRRDLDAYPPFISK